MGSFSLPVNYGLCGGIKKEKNKNKRLLGCGIICLCVICFLRRDESRLYMVQEAIVSEPLFPETR